MDKKLKESIQDKINFSEEFCRFSKTKLSLLNYSLFRDDKYRELYNKYIDKCYKLNLFRRNSQDTVLFSTQLQRDNKELIQQVLYLQHILYELMPGM